MGLFESAVSAPRHSFGGIDQYTKIEDKAASLLFSIVNNHPFVDGNKRTGFVAMPLFLEINKIHFKASNEDVVQFVFDIASSKKSIGEISSWIRKHTPKLK